MEIMWKCYILIANFSLCRFLAQCHWKTIEVNWTKFSLNQYMLCIHSSKQLFLTKFSIGTSWEIIKNGNILTSEPFNKHSLILHIKPFIFNGQFLRVGIDRISFFLWLRGVFYYIAWNTFYKNVLSLLKQIWHPKLISVLYCWI